ncbi:ribose 5-phosphate isomerase [Caloranaerobacter sp. TR13]|uniref:ribose 5-phosphate isomerase B n=1 Tax=Caloranaerobacter sp. TR13 TaxID=1302151 RepID=UPI0006D48123|nr:ribose 5-phosphate isomerase B [Caloranaerobacter sp. TR13]KPU27405.1 ribose 5-phosphate isomerase [Caloranaerobacter sp. TR13]
MKIALGSDHGGYELKEHIKKFLEEKNIEYVDYGTNSTESVDYPDFGHKVAKAVKEGKCDRGIVCCGTGIGISISVNKVPGVRCALVSDCYSARMSREHNDANVLALGARVIGRDLALEIVDIWLKTEFQGGRHERRVNKIKEIEERYSKC